MANPGSFLTQPKTTRQSAGAAAQSNVQEQQSKYDAAARALSGASQRAMTGTAVGQSPSSSAGGAYQMGASYPTAHATSMAVPTFSTQGAPVATAANLPAGMKPNSGIAAGWAAGNTAYQAAVNGTHNPNLPSSSSTSTPPKLPPAPNPTQPVQPKPNPTQPTQPPPNNSFTPTGTWAPTPFSSTPYATPPTAPAPPDPMGALGGLLNRPGGADIFNPDNFISNDGKIPNWLSQIKDIVQMQQNAYQYSNDATRAGYQDDRDYLAHRQNDIYQQQLSTRQQDSAEWQALEADKLAKAQFGQQQKTDQWGHEIAQGGLANDVQQTANQLKVGMDANAAQRYGADQQLAGAGLYAGAQKYGADQGLAGQKYQADQGLAGQLGSANIYAGAQKYGADQGLAGQLGSANIYAGAQNYGADQGLAGTKYASDIGYQAAQLQNSYLLQQLAQQAQQNEKDRQTQLQMANLQAYGRSQAPQASWAVNWS